MDIDETSTTHGVSSTVTLSSNTIHGSTSNLLQPQEMSESDLLTARGHPETLIGHNSPQIGSVQLNLEGQASDTAPVDVFMGQTVMNAPLFSFDNPEPVNVPGSLFTEFIKDLIDIPAEVSLERPVREESQVPFNMWDTFMTTPEDWTDDLINFDLDAFKDDLFQDPSFNVAQISAGSAISNRQERHPSMSIGVQAFKTSFWNWVPHMDESGSAERAAMGLGSQMPEQLNRFSEEVASAFDKHCSSADRARFLELLITNSPKANMLRVISAFPSTALIDGLLQWAMHLLATQALGWFHVPTFDPQSAPVELLASVIAYGACMTPIKEIQRLGYSILEIVKSAIIDRVCSTSLALQAFTLFFTTLMESSGIWTTVKPEIFKCYRHIVRHTRLVSDTPSIDSF